MSQVIEKIKKELDEFNAKKVQLVEELRVEFPKLFTELFAQADKIDSVSWTQYTPYFNDGESCVFSAHVDYLRVNGDDWEEDDTLKPFLVEKLVDEEAVAVSHELSLKYDKSHLVNRKVGEYGLVPNPDFDVKNGTVVQEIRSILLSIPEEFFLELFDDHSEVTIYKDGKIEVTEYEHD